MLILEVVVVACTVSIGNVELEAIVPVSEAHCAVFANVYRNVVPTRFVKGGHDASRAVLPVV